MYKQPKTKQQSITILLATEKGVPMFRDFGTTCVSERSLFFLVLGFNYNSLRQYCKFL